MAKIFKYLNPKKNMTKALDGYISNIKKHLKYLAYIIFAAIIILLILFFLKFDVSDILKYSLESPLQASLIILGLYCLKSLIVVIPLMALYISAGMMFPFGWALAITAIGLFFEMTIGYFIGKRLKIDRVTNLMTQNKRAEKFLLSQKNINPSLCFLTRLSPLNFDLTSMFHGAYNINYPQYIVYSFLGSAPRMIPFVFVGDSISTPFSKEFLIPFIIIVVVTAFAFTIYMKQTSKTKQTHDNIELNNDIHEESANQHL